MHLNQVLSSKEKIALLEPSDKTDKKLYRMNTMILFATIIQYIRLVTKLGQQEFDGIKRQNIRNVQNWHFGLEILWARLHEKT